MIRIKTITSYKISKRKKEALLERLKQKTNVQIEIGTKRDELSESETECGRQG